MILEGIVTTRNEDGTTNVAPMGPIVDPAMHVLRLRPFRTSRTYANLARDRQGVLHVVDDVLLLARAAIGRLEETPETMPAEVVDGDVLVSACRWYEFEIVSLDDSTERTEAEAEVRHVGRLRDFFGFNRAKHAVLEAAILATRLHLIPRDEIEARLDDLSSPVEKTAGPAEREAFALIRTFVEAADR